MIMPLLEKREKMFNEERELLLPELESTQSALVLNTSMHPEHAPSQSTEPHDVTMALLAKAFGSAVTSIGTLDNSSKIAVDNNQQLDVEGWNLRRRVGLALEAIFSPAAEKDLQKAFHRDERTLDMLDKQTFTYAQQLMSIKGDPEQDTEAQRLKAAIFRQLKQKLQDNKTLSELERQSIADVAKVALSSDEDSKQHVYTTLNDKGYEKVRDDTRDRWIHGCYNAFLSSSIKALSVLAAPACGGWGGVALGTVVETAALHASTLKMQESAVLRSEEQRAKSIDGVLKQFLATHDASTGAKPVIIERFEQELRSFKDSGRGNLTEVYSSAATIIAAGARLKELVESGEATLSAMTYKGYQEVLTYAERTKEKLKETVELPEGTKDATSLADYAGSLQRAASTLGRGNDVHIDVDQIRNAERDRLKKFTDRQLDEVRAKVVNPVRIVKTACLAGIGHSSAVLCAGLSEVGKQFQGIQAVGVHDNVMQLHEHVVDVAQQALSDQTGLPEWTTRPIAELYSVVTKAWNEHTLGGAEQFNKLFVATRKLQNGSIQELSAAEMRQIGTEAVGRSFTIQEGLSKEFIGNTLGENREKILKVAQQLNALTPKGYEQARFYDFSLNGETYQKAAEVIGESFSTIARVSFAAQVVFATGGINIEGSEREGWKLPKLGLFLRGSKQKVQDTNEQHVENRFEESPRTSLESAQEEQAEPPLVMEAALEKRSDITTVEAARATFEKYRNYFLPDAQNHEIVCFTDAEGAFVSIAEYSDENQSRFFLGYLKPQEQKEHIIQCTVADVAVYNDRNEVVTPSKSEIITYAQTNPAALAKLIYNSADVNITHQDSQGENWTKLHADYKSIFTGLDAPREFYSSRGAEAYNNAPASGVPLSENIQSAPSQTATETNLVSANSHGVKTEEFLEVPFMVGDSLEYPENYIPDREKDPQGWENYYLGYREENSIKPEEGENNTKDSGFFGAVSQFFRLNRDK
jgi:hypothetical protein